MSLKKVRQDLQMAGTGRSCLDLRMCRPYFANSSGSCSGSSTNSRSASV